MKCVMCGKSMDKAAFWVGPNPIGPKCLLKMQGKKNQSKSVAVRNEQEDLFDELARRNPQKHP